MKKLLFILCICPSLPAAGEEDLSAKAAALTAEGKRLYVAEMASWQGTDLFFEMYRDKDKMGGYLSYADGTSAKCIFYSRSETPKVIWTITFDSTFNPERANIDIVERDLSAHERDLYHIRQATMLALQSDTLFKAFEHTNFNLVPVIHEDTRAVYVLTGPKQAGVVVFGNDYLLTFNGSNELQSRKKLHKNIIPVPYGDQGQEANAKETLHIHLPETGDFITATDICTLMLYERFAGWEQHTVVSKKYVSIWNCKTDQLTIIPTASLEKIDKETEKQSSRAGRK